MDIVSDRTVTADETKHQHRHRLPIHLNTRTFTSHLCTSGADSLDARCVEGHVTD